MSNNPWLFELFYHDEFHFRTLYGTGYVNEGNRKALFGMLATLWILFGLFILYHIVFIRDTIFQAVYIRIILFFPLSATVLSLLAQYDRAIMGDFLVALMEGYVFIAFFGVMVAWGWKKGNVHEALMQSESTSFFWFRFFEFGRKFQNGKSMLNALWWQTAQMIILKPIINGIQFRAVKHAGSTHDLQTMLRVCFSFLNVTTVGIATLALLRVYRALYRSPKVCEEKGVVNLLDGFCAVFKFLIVKILVFFMILNEACLASLLDSRWNVPENICSDSADYCIRYFVSFLFSAECVLFMLPAMLVYPSQSPDDSKQKPRRNKYPQNSMKLLARIFHICDIIYLTAYDEQKIVDYRGSISDFDGKNSFRVSEASEPEIQKSPSIDVSSSV